jgi:hypothetical protein
VNPNTHELAWAAGFFDGEGSVLYRGRKRRELCLTVSQADRRPLDRFAAAIGMPGVRGPYRPRNANGKPYFVFSVAAHTRVQAIVAMLWRFLSEPKRQQASVALTAAVPYLRVRFIHGARGRSALSLVEADALRAEYESLRGASGRINRGARPALVTKYGLKSVNTLAAICAGRGYNQKGGGK